MKKLFVTSMILLTIIVEGNAQTWSAMDIGLYQGTGGATGVYAIQQYNNTIYAGGVFQKAGNISATNIAQWNSNVWDSVSNGNMGTLALTIYNGSLVSGAASYLLQWNGITWSKLGPDTSFFFKKDTSLSNPKTYALTLYNSTLISGGSFDSVPGMYANNIAYWNGINWNTFSTGFTGRDTSIVNIGSINVSINALVIYNGNLYAAGYFNSAGGAPIHNVAMWNGTSWLPLGTGVNNVVYALTVCNGNLYAGGYFDTAGGVPVHNIAAWNGSIWSPVGGIMNKKGEIYSLAADNNILYAGGVFDTIGGVAANNIAYWDGNNWYPIGRGISSFSNSVYVDVIYNYNNTLYVGGTFDSAGGIYAENIAMCTNPTGIYNINHYIDYTLYPNPNNGEFTLQFKNEESRVKGTAKIYNMLGEIVYSTPLNLSQMGDFQINLSNQPDGPYLYRVTNETGALIGEGKFVIVR